MESNEDNNTLEAAFIAAGTTEEERKVTPISTPTLKLTVTATPTPTPTPTPAIKK